MSRKKTEEKGMTYASSGVDIEEEGKAIRELVSALSFKRKGFGGAVDLSGHFTGLIDIGDSYLSMCTDGVGSKLEIARELEKWDTVGIDCMAMNVNDIICIGAEPLAFVDYIALEEPSARILSEIGKGLNEGARLSNLTIIGGETATLPDIVHGLDLAGTCLGIVPKDRVITGREVSPGDLIIGLPSSGLHSNGFTLVRRVVRDAELSYISPLEEIVGSTDWMLHTRFPHYRKEVEEWAREEGSIVLGELLLEPTTIYVKPVLELLKEVDTGAVKGMANITGGGIRNLSRLGPDLLYKLNSMPPVPKVFRLVQVLGAIDEKEMYQTFNMGLGMALIIRPEYREKVLDLLSGSGASVIGRVEMGRGVEMPELELHFEGYV